jgi:hypothetical protein
MQKLSQSLRNRVAELEALPVLHRNRHLFGNCDKQFLSALMLVLTEVYLMPGEQVLKCGDMARELSFAKKGTLVVTDRKDLLVELISGEGTSECVVGAVSFFMGMLPLVDSCSTDQCCATIAEFVCFMIQIRLHRVHSIS